MNECRLATIYLATIPVYQRPTFLSYVQYFNIVLFRSQIKIKSSSEAWESCDSGSGKERVLCSLRQTTLAKNVLLGRYLFCGVQKEFCYRQIKLGKDLRVHIKLQNKHVKLYCP